jgi:hypothetical protein
MAATQMMAVKYMCTNFQPSSYLDEPNDLMPYFIAGNPVNFIGNSNPQLDILWVQSTITDLN